jgi:hypothetical protein
MNQLAERASGGNLRRELSELSVHAQKVGVEASARTAAIMNEFASRMAGMYRETAVPGLDAARALSARMAFLTSGSVADALSDPTGSKKAK